MSEPPAPASDPDETDSSDSPAPHGGAPSGPTAGHPPHQQGAAHGPSPDGPPPGAQPPGGPATAHQPGADGNRSAWESPQGGHFRFSGDGRPLSSFFDSLRRTGLVRTEQRLVGGVAGGLAQRLGVDPVLVRVVWAVLTVFTGLGLLLYGIGWAFLPEQRDGRIHAEQLLAGDLDAGLAGAVVCAVTGIGLADQGLLPSWYFWGWWDDGFIGALAWAAIIIVGLLALGAWLIRRPGSGPAADRRQAGRAAPIGPRPGGPAPFQGPAGGHPGAPGPTPPAAGGSPYAAAGRFQGPPPGGAALHAAPHSQPNRFPPYGPPVPIIPPRPLDRVPGPGRRTSLIVLGLILLCLAACGLFAAQAPAATGPISSAGLLASGAGIAAIAIGSATVLIGLGIAISGLRGRRGAWMIALSWPLVIISALSLSIASVLPYGTINAWLPHDPVVIVVTDERLAQAPSGVLDLGDYSAAHVTIDLTGLKNPTPTEVSINVGAGEVVVLAGTNQSIEVRSDIGAGSAHGDLIEQWEITGTASTSTAVAYTDATTPDYAGYNGQFDLHGDDIEQTTVHSTDVLNNQVTWTSPAARSGADVELRIDLGIGAVKVRQMPDEVVWEGIVYPDYWIVAGWTEPNGTWHPDTDLPVPGMTHPAVSAFQALACLDQTDDGPWEDLDYNDIDDIDDLYLLDQMTPQHRAAFDECIAPSLTSPESSSSPDDPAPGAGQDEAVPYPQTGPTSGSEDAGPATEPAPEQTAWPSPEQSPAPDGTTTN